MCEAFRDPLYSACGGSAFASFNMFQQGFWINACSSDLYCILGKIWRHFYSNCEQFRYQLFATFQRPVLVCIECIQSFLLFVLMENGQKSSSCLDGTWSLLRFACQGSHCRDEAGGGHQEMYWELRAFGSNPFWRIWRTVMSTAILVASFACFFLDSVCFRHCSFDGILRGACPKGDPRYSLWFPVIHYGSLSCSLRNPMVP